MYPITNRTYIVGRIKQESWRAIKSSKCIFPCKFEGLGEGAKRSELSSNEFIHQPASNSENGPENLTDSFLFHFPRERRKRWEWKNEKSSAVEILNLKFDDHQEPINEEERTFIPYFRNERGETRSISFALPGETHLSILDETVLLLSCLLPSFPSFAAESRSRHRDLEPFRSRRLRFLES